MYEKAIAELKEKRRELIARESDLEDEVVEKQKLITDLKKQITDTASEIADIEAAIDALGGTLSTFDQDT